MEHPAMVELVSVSNVLLNSSVTCTTFVKHLSSPEILKDLLPEKVAY